MTISLKSSSAIVLALGVLASPALADMDAAKAFLDKEIAGVSTLSRADQEAEMKFFVDASAPYQGMEIKVVSEPVAATRRPGPRTKTCPQPLLHPAAAFAFPADRMRACLCVRAWLRACPCTCLPAT